MKKLLTITLLLFSLPAPAMAEVRWVVLETKIYSNPHKMAVSQWGNGGFKSKEDCEKVMRQEYLFEGYEVEKREYSYGSPDLIFKIYHLRNNYISGKEIAGHPILGNWED